jgi:prepilin-type N-terminal cleavage/methylation domain-containing protein
MIGSMDKHSAGFTWLELLFVVVVIAILAMLAIPGLQETALRKQVSEALKLASVATAGVQLAYSLKGEMPANNAAKGLHDKHLTLRPAVVRARRASRSRGSAASVLVSR